MTSTPSRYCSGAMPIGLRSSTPALAHLEVLAWMRERPPHAVTQRGGHATDVPSSSERSEFAGTNALPELFVQGTTEEELMEGARRDTHTAEQPTGTSQTSDVVNSDPLGKNSGADESVAQRAYRRFEERGGEHGRDLDDWLEAERELGRTTTE
jgi:hypothetical protein